MRGRFSLVDVLRLEAHWQLLPFGIATGTTPQSVRTSSSELGGAVITTPETATSAHLLPLSCSRSSMELRPA